MHALVNCLPWTVYSYWELPHSSVEIIIDTPNESKKLVLKDCRHIETQTCKKPMEPWFKRSNTSANWNWNQFKPAQRLKEEFYIPASGVCALIELQNMIQLNFKTFFFLRSLIELVFDLNNWFYDENLGSIQNFFKSCNKRLITSSNRFPSLI